MKYLTKQCVLAFFAVVFVFTAHADLIDVTSDTRSMATELANKFVVGCAILAAGIVLAAFISRRKI